MNRHRRGFARAGLLTGLAAASITAGVHAQAYPSRPIRLIVGYTTGGAVDTIARAMAQQLTAALGQPVVVENRPGGGTNIASRALIDSAPDGHTLMLAANALAANPALYSPAPYDLAREITPVSLVGRVPVVLVVGTLSESGTLGRFIAAAKARPLAVNYGSPGNGSTPHLAVELFERAAGITLTHVPYKGGSQAITDLLGGHVQAVAVNALEVQPHVRSGRVKVLAVMAPTRSGIFPEVPTVAESGFPGFEASVWYAFVGPAGLPGAVVVRLHGEIQRALDTPEMRERLRAAGGEVLPGSTAQLAALLASERARYEKLIREAGIKPD